MTSDTHLEFGTRVHGQTYQPRPGSYAVMLNDRGEIAVLRTPQGFFLPGGDADVDESAEAALRREVFEECGCEIEIVRMVGSAVEYVFSEREGYFAKQCSFFQAKMGIPVAQREHDHELMWMAPSDAIAKLTHGSQSWAVAQIDVS